MPDVPDDVLLAGEYFLGVQGFAVMRWCVLDPGRARARVQEMRDVLGSWDDKPNSFRIPVKEHDVASGYERWAPNYDGPNPAIEQEEPFVRPMLDALAPGDALDAACGTGRHAAYLAARGHRVIGVDATEGMLAVARAKLPAADFRAGRLEALPVDDASVDVVTCSLALTHVADLRPVFAEFGRVLRPGGQLITSDMHPMVTLTGGMAGFPNDDGSRDLRYVRNITHRISDYVGAMTDAGLKIEECHEPAASEELLGRTFPSYALYPQATLDAMLGLPYLLIWRASKAT